MGKQAIRPSVFAVGRNYQIFVPLDIHAVMWVRVGDNTYYDDANGILRSETWLHKVEVPMDELNAAGAYTVVCREIEERKPYFTRGEEPFEETFRFYPVKEDADTVNLYHVSDAHNMVDLPVAAGRERAEETDVLILNGDNPNDCQRVENLKVVYDIAYGITRGEKPVVFARGNHDNRGVLAEEFSRFTPTDNGNTFFTFRLGSLWGIVLDCGEDKPDDHEEYGPTVCFHAFRQRESAFLDRVIAHAKEEYDAPGVKHKVLICHVPFFMRHKPPFNIEEDIYTYWLRRLKEDVRPDVFLCGHTHVPKTYLPGGEADAFGLQPCPAIVGSGVKYGTAFTGGLITLGKGEPQAEFNTVQKNEEG